GAAAAHALSRPYPGYSQRETTEKLAHALQAAGPRTCQSIRNELDGEPYCATCPHWGKIRSPIVLGMPRADRPPPPTDADAPPDRGEHAAARNGTGQEPGELTVSAEEGLPECGHGPLAGTPPGDGSL